ncbi:MAG: hypothetical protein KGI64_09600 [Xanthomonadaceae bacterium]|nr:hypothetical protein [Xanthomonadaceae bacterium]MDE1961711.1 hypothetical protein [Xanthomonadaceae bacterium]MDE2085102.1 hypothetical protein [Xanthomonadaceae bacterium]MDE2258466.1 hypothetical protein [Xanthomonadaceae bacterium]
MPTEQQRAAMLAAMGIDVYRLRHAAAESPGAARIFIDAQTRVCVSGASEDVALPWLSLALRIPAAQIHYTAVDTADGVVLDGGALPRDAAGKRRLWLALKPLARRLQDSA